MRARNTVLFARSINREPRLESSSARSGSGLGWVEISRNGNLRANAWLGAAKMCIPDFFFWYRLGLVFCSECKGNYTFLRHLHVSSPHCISSFFFRPRTMRTREIDLGTVPEKMSLDSKCIEGRKVDSEEKLNSRGTRMELAGVVGVV